MSTDSEYTCETHFVVYGRRGKVSVRPDGDGLGLIEVDGGDDFGRLVIDAKGALLVARVMHDLAKIMIDAEAVKRHG